MDLILLQPGDAQIFGGQGGSSGMDTELCQSFGIKDQCIELISIHQGMKQQITTDVSNSARTSGRPIITEFTLAKYVDDTSVKLYEYCLRALPLGKGKQQPTMLYIARNSGDNIANILTISLRDAIVSEIQMQSHPNDMPTEQFKLNFTEILWTYHTQKADSSSTQNITSGWSLSRNRPIGEFTE